MYTLSCLWMTNLFPWMLALFFSFLLATSLSYSVSAETIIFSFPPKDNITLYENLDAYFQGETIQLTKNQAIGTLQTSFGWAVYNKSIPIWDNSSQALANFTTHFQFVISEVGNSSYAGDGITFFMAPLDFEAPANAVGRWLGLFNETTNGNSSNQIVAVEFDTFRNYYRNYSNKIYFDPDDNHVGIDDSMVFFDPDDNHVGIDVNSIFSKVNVSLSKIASDPFQNETFKNDKYWDAWVDYNGGKKQLQVFLLLNPSGNVQNISKPASPILSYPVDLRKFLPKKIKIGLSASTGRATETHTVYAWNFSCECSRDSGISSAAPRNRVSKENSVKFILITLFACILCVCCVMFLARRWYSSSRKIQRGDQAAQEGEENMDEYISQGPHKFSYKELSIATRNFTEDEKLGEGGFGGVYRGILPATNEPVAVKRISQGSKQGKKEYISEVTIISKLRHRNLVQLLGWCHEKSELLLVYEFLANGSLDQYIFGKRKGLLDWDRRYRIACDIASALLYIHEDSDQCVVHRDVKASNVLLDSGFTAKLGDFGLARFVEHDHSSSHTTVAAGTWGYIAPECLTTAKASPESDVFSFGAVTLEIACGRRTIDDKLGPDYNCRLVQWVWGLYGQGRVLDASDEALGGKFNGEQMERLMLVGLSCSHPDPKSRPKIREILKILKLEAQMPYVPLNFPVAVYSDSFSIRTGSSHTTSISCSSSLSSKGKMYGLLFSEPEPRP